MVTTKAIMARAAKFITDNTWGTNWHLYLSVFDIADIADDIPRLYRSQSWEDDDYPDQVHYLFLAIVDYNESIAFDFLRYVITQEFNLEDDKVVSKDPELLTALGLIEGKEKKVVSYPSVEISPKKFIDIQVLPDDFYKDLQDELNKAFAYNILSAVQILSRKFLENLIIDILRKKYGTKEIDLYYNTQRRRFQGFEILLKNLSDKMNSGDFDGISDAFNKDFLRRVNAFREQGNSSAHSIELKLDRSRTEKNGEELNFLIKVLIRVLNSCS